MKKVLYILIAVGLLMALSTYAFADLNTWVANLKGSDANGQRYNTAKIGWASTTTNGVDAGEDTNPGPAVTGNSNVAIANLNCLESNGPTYSDGIGLNDYRLALAKDPGATYIYRLGVWYQDNGGGPIDPLKVVMTMTANTFPAGYLLKLDWNDGTAIQHQVWDSTNAPTSFTMTFPGVAERPTPQAPSIMVTVTPVPEPGSLLALGSGLIGLAGFAIRRRRA